MFKMMVQEIILLKKIHLIEYDEARDTRRSSKGDHDLSWVGPILINIESAINSLAVWS